jgi:cell division protease FtsH
VVLGQDIAQQLEFSESTAHEIDREIESILDAAYERAVDSLRQHRDGLERVTGALLAEEEMSGDRVRQAIDAQENEA